MCSLYTDWISRCRVLPLKQSPTIQLLNPEINIFHLSGLNRKIVVNHEQTNEKIDYVAMIVLLCGGG